MTGIEESDKPHNPDINTYVLTSKSKREQLEALSQDEQREWVSREHSYWQEISRAVNTQKGYQQVLQTHAIFISEIEKYLAKLGDFAKPLQPGHYIINDEEASPTADTYIAAIFEVNLPHHDDSLAVEFKSACHSGQAAAVIYAFKSLTKNSETDYYQGYTEGVAKNLKSISSVIDHKISETITELSSKEANLSESIQSAEDRLNMLFKASKAAIALSAPVKYWEDRKMLHKESAKKYGILSLISGTIFAITLGTVIVNEYSAGLSYSLWIYSLTLPKSISGIALILLISTAGIWSTRIFVKLMMANLTLESESLERATMIKTFVAMKAVESSMAQEAELLFYTTLFRPSNNVINEESTAPEFGKLLDAVLKAKSDKADA